MMRVMLFRGKRVDNGEWVISDCIYQCGGIVKLWDEPSRDGWVEVIHETVGQYTGLKDKNSKKIFEGDIVKTQLNAYLLKMIDYTVVSFDGGAFGLRWKRCGLSGGVEQFTAFTSICNTEYEVVGNIHDNPNLLEVQDE